MLEKTENEETRLFCQIFVIGGISIEGAWTPWATPLATPMIFRQDCALKFFHKKKIYSKIEITFFPKRGELESFQTSKNCMTLS